MAYTKYSLTPANNNAAPPDGAPEGMLPSAVNDTMRDMMAQIRDVGDGIRGGTYTMTAPVITGGSITGVALSGNTLTNPVITGGSINNTPIGATTANTGKFTTLTNAALTSGRVTYAGTSGVLQDDADFTFNGTTVTMANDASISGLTVGKGGGSLTDNTTVGNAALASNTTGAYNTAVGRQALTSNATGAENSAFGWSSLYSNTGSNNTALGTTSLYANTSGGSNTAVGNQALRFNTTASDNTAVGNQSAYSNTTGANLVAVGKNALYTNTTGINNTSVGLNSLYLNTTGAYNVAVGMQALNSNTTADNNTAVGYQAGYSNTTGNQIACFGKGAGYTNTTGTDNTLIGFHAGYTLNSGGNVAVGSDALSSCTSGSLNTAVGYSAGNAITTGSKNTILGRYTGNQGGLDIRTASNYIVLSDGDGNPNLRIGHGVGTWMPQLASGAGTNAVRFNTSTGQITYDTSSARYKDNIRDSVYGLNHVMQMRSAQFEYKDDSRSDIGLIAEELNLIIPELVAKNKDNEPDAVSYDRMVSVLIKAVQELKTEFDAYKATHP
jgi:hypothetical protein